MSDWFDWVSLVATVLALLVVASGYVSWRATRLDRLHTRLETAHAALDAALVRRTAVVLELASAPELEPASAVLLADAAGRARRANEEGDGNRELAESNLSRTLRAVVEEPDFRAAMVAGPDDGEGGSGAELLAEVEAAAKRVYLARRFYNDAVASTRQARARRLARLLRLSGRAPAPEFFEMDDEPPAFDPLA